MRRAARRDLSRSALQEGTLAKSLLSTAIDDADLDAGNAVDLLDAIPGAYERALLGRAQAERAVPLESL